MQQEEEEDEVETHSEQYTIIISSHHLQQPARKSNPRKWNPTLLLAQLRPPSTGPRNGISAKTKEIIIIIVWTMGRIQFSICCCCARFAIIIIIIFVDIFYPLCRCWFPFVQWLNCIYFREKSWTSFSRFCCDISCWIVGSFFPFPHLSDLLDEYWVYWVTPANWQRWRWWWVATRTTTTIEQNELLKWNSSTHCTKIRFLEIFHASILSL